MKPFLILALAVLMLSSCNRNDNENNNSADSTRVYYDGSKFVMGADLSYVNQILDHGGAFRDSGIIKNPYSIFRQYGTNVVRLRLFYNPSWTKDVYGTAGTQMYNDFHDVKKAVSKAKEAGMKVCLDFHYSDSWADPSKQVVPDAWKNLLFNQLHDSLYAYTYRTLHKLDLAGLMPEYVQTGNEINPGFVLPRGNRWDGNETNMISLLNSAIKAVRDASAISSVKPRIIIHIAQPENVAPWFTGLEAKGLTDYDIIGFSYYYMWSTVLLQNISNNVAAFRNAFHKDVMIMETAYPWTTGNADSYANIITVSKLNSKYPATIKGQYEYLHALTQEVIDGGGKGIIVWEPAWITSQMKDPWGTGSSWDCNTLFDFSGNVIRGMRFMTDKYTFNE